MPFRFNPFTDKLDLVDPGGGGANVETITGNDGVAEPAIANNFNIVSSNSTVKFKGSAATETLNFQGDTNSNLLMGSSGPSLTSGTENIGVGKSALNAIASGNQNTAVGAFAGQNLTGSSNVIVGNSAMSASTNTNSNIAIGANALENYTGTGSGFNVSIGHNSMLGAFSGTNNIGLGENVGNAFTTTESSNILLGNSAGTIGDNHTTRIGVQGSGAGQQNKCFIAGITGVSTSNSNITTIDTTSGQLGAASNLPVSLGGTGVATLTGVPYGDGTSAFTGIVPLWYGDGSDGSVTFDGSTTILGLIPSSSIYTLTSDIFLASSTINNGVTIITSNFRIYCNGTLTNNGTISANGNNGTNGASGSAGGAAFSGSIGGNGGGGLSSTGNGGNAATSLIGIGGSGGAAGAGGIGTAGNGTTVIALSATQGSYRGLSTFLNGWTSNLSTTPVSLVRSGGGGGGGGGDGTHRGGAGGAGGGSLMILAYLIAGTGNIQAKGGNGGNGDPLGNCGGGGAGGGGFIMILSKSSSGNAISGQTLSVVTGSIGNKSGTGANGNTGNSGTIYCVAA